ncbi:hypothetical protein Moror_13736 [Moniliophthora roreri MCA 2997]|uniref:Uncharacterized protein n=1 Tax=Moniliophthora roreri (strain MCA 2997) TaxID=1381753 RepID=V2WU22_MONRO|nr:hypothetical protein Moror_13736 [Moniliophthora roreri MCA 2997]
MPTPNTFQTPVDGPLDITKMTTSQIEQYLAQKKAQESVLPGGLPHTAAQLITDLQAAHQSDELLKAMLHYLRQRYPDMQELARCKRGLPQWLPDKTKYLEHLSSMNIPRAKQRGGDIPNLLLHRLGSLDDADLDSRLERLFASKRHRLFLNTPGSGKTRTVLEGLARFWGLYFTCNQDPFLGSQDLSMGMESLKHRLTTIENNLQLGLLLANQQAAGRKLTGVLLSRIVIMEYFTSFIKDTTITNEHRLHWLYLQVCPSLLDCDDKSADIFHDLTLVLEDANLDVLRMTSILSLSLSSICSNLRLKEDNADLYIVIDEAQTAVKKYATSFRSQDYKIPRPILRELVVNWAELIPDTGRKAMKATYIITGTGIDMELIRDALSSTTCKSDKVYKVSHSGIFDTAASQQHYALPFFPAEIARSVGGKVLLERMFYWLRGRHRFTAEFIAMLLRADFHNPHILLSDYVKHIAGFYPTDAPDQFTLGTSLPLLDFSTGPIPVDNVTANTTLMETVRQSCHDYALHSIVPQYVGVAKDVELVQHGLARFKERVMNVDEMGKAKIKYFVAVDEPLVLLACSAYLNNVGGPRARYDYSLHGRVMKDIRTHSPQDGRNGFEDCIATYFAMAFAKPTKLSSVFNSVSPRYCKQVLLNRRAQIVAYHRSWVDGQNIDSWGTYDIRPGMEQSLAGCLGSSGMHSDSRDPQSALLGWLRFEGREAFCFPSNLMGPDILFLLRLTKEEEERDPDYFSYMWVAVQCKNHNSYKHLPDGALIDAVKTVTPNRFFIPRDKNVVTASVTQKRNRLDVLGTFSELPNKEPLAGKYSVLRVVVGYPAKADFKEILASSQKTRRLESLDRQHSHPLVTLDIQALKERYRELGTAVLNEMESRAIVARRARKGAIGDLHAFARAVSAEWNLDEWRGHFAAMTSEQLRTYLEHFRHLPGVNLPKTYRGPEHRLQDLLEEACIAYYRYQNGIEVGPESEDEELEDADNDSSEDAIMADVDSSAGVFTDDAMKVDDDLSLTSVSSQDDEEMPNTNGKRRTATMQLRTWPKRAKLGSR